MATLANFGIPSISSTILHPKMKFLWRVTFLEIGRLVPGTTTRDLSAQATNITRPNLTWEEVTVHRYNSVSTLGGKHTWEPINLTVEDDINGLASKVITAQMETQQRLIGVDLDGRWLNRAASGSDYKFGMKLEQLEGDELVLEQWLIEGCHIVNADFGDLDYSASEAATITMSIRYDHARRVDTGAGAALGTALGGHVAG